MADRAEPEPQSARDDRPTNAALEGSLNGPRDEGDADPPVHSSHDTAPEPHPLDGDDEPGNKDGHDAPHDDAHHHAHDKQDHHDKHSGDHNAHDGDLHSDVAGENDEVRHLHSVELEAVPPTAAAQRKRLDDGTRGPSPDSEEDDPHLMSAETENIISATLSGRISPVAEDEGAAQRSEIRDAIGAFEDLVTAARVPFLDASLLRKYAVPPPPPPPEAAATARERRDAAAQLQHQLENTRIVVKALKDHKRNTLSVLQAIAPRDRTVDSLVSLGETIASGHANTVEAQAAGLRLLYQLQKQTLEVVERVVRWRTFLTRPFAFAFEGDNYLLQILCDNARIERSGLTAVLPMQLVQHPLLSNVPSLALFQHEHPSTTVSPVKSRNRNIPPAFPAAYHRRLLGAEQYLKAEVNGQLALHRELLGLCQAGRYVPVIAIPGIVPPRSAQSGVPLRSLEWIDRVQTALLASLQRLVDLPATVEDPNKRGGDEEAGEGRRERIEGKGSRHDAAYEVLVVEQDGDQDGGLGATQPDGSEPRATSAESHE